MRKYKGNGLIVFPDSYVIIDIETTGLDPSNDAIIEVAGLKIKNNTIVDSFSSLINPGFLISDFISDLTGITNDQLSSAPNLSSVLNDFYIFLGNNILIGHNIHFDLNFLYDNMEKELGKFLSNDFIDTLRMSRRFVKQAPSHKLSALANYFQIPVDASHRALADCKTTYALYNKLKYISNNISDEENSLLASLHYDSSSPLYGKKIAVKGLPQYYSFEFMKSVSKKCNAQLTDIFFKDCDYIVFAKYTYKRYVQGEDSEKFEKAKALVSAGTLTVLSEDEWCQMMDLPVPEFHSKPKLNANDITTDNTDFDETHPLYGKLCVFTGTLEKMTRKEAMQCVVDIGGSIGNSVTKKTNYLILGNNDYSYSLKGEKSSKQKKAESLKLSGHDIEIISENVFYDMLDM